MSDRAMLGSKLRRLRQKNGLSQVALAARLGISASYLNLIEHDERPVTATLLIKVGTLFNLDLQNLSGDDERKQAQALRELFADPLLAAHAVAPEDLARVAGSAPDLAKAVVDLYRAYKIARDDAQSLAVGEAGGAGGGRRRITLPTEEARDFFNDRTNHFAGLEEAAEELVAAARLEVADTLRGLRDHLLAAHGVAIEVADPQQLGGVLRRYEPASRRLVLSSALPPSARAFQAAYQLGLLTARAIVDGIVAEAALASEESKSLVRIGLLNYFAAAIMMPYQGFLDAARRSRHDIEVLTTRFGASFEQVCHRLTTLGRPGARGIPFFLVRVDIAGNISKRYSAAGFHFSRFGGSCPRWIVHECFMTPGLIRTQIARLQDGATYLCVARTVTKSGGRFREPRSHLALGIGCDIQHAGELVYADGQDVTRLDAATEIGVGCRLCERTDCRQRAFPPLNHRLLLNEREKARSAYPFLAE